MVCYWNLLTWKVWVFASRHFGYHTHAVQSAVKVYGSNYISWPESPRPNKNGSIWIGGTWMWMVWHRHGCHNAVPTSHKAAYFARTYTTSSSLLHFASLTEPLQVIHVRQFARKYNFMQTNQRECLQRVHFHKENVFFSYMHASVFARQQSVEHFLPFLF